MENNSDKLYRAVLKQNFNPLKIYSKYSTPRMPANIPYVVDNLWEYLRPEEMPSRRFAVYASPTPELALKNASNKEIDRNSYVVCRVDIKDKNCKVAQLSLEDARLHSDVKLLTRLMVESLGEVFSSDNHALRTVLAPVFAPVLPRTEMQRLADSYTILKDTLNKVTNESTFWSSASNTIQTDGLGEVFFELAGGSSSNYQLSPI